MVSGVRMVAGMVANAGRLVLLLLRSVSAMKTFVLHSVCSSNAAALLLAVAASTAADYPVRPVRVIVPYSPGGGTDFTARTLAQRLTATLGQSFVGGLAT